MDRCIPLIDVVSGVSFQYRFDFFFNGKDQVALQYDSLLRDAMAIVLKPHELEYEICESSVMETKLEGGNMVIKTIISKYVVEPTRMRETLNEIKENIDDMNKRNKANGLLYTISLGESPFQNMFTNESRFLSYEYFGYFCSNLIAISERQFCRLVAIQNYQMGHGEITVNGTVFYNDEFFFSTDETSYTTAYVCEDLYVTKMTMKERLSANNGNNLPFEYVGQFLVVIVHFARYYNH